MEHGRNQTQFLHVYIIIIQICAYYIAAMRHFLKRYELLPILQGEY